MRNGNFETPVLSSDFLVSTPGNVPDWTSVQSEMGRGPFYNPRWTSQVLELTANKNVAYTQIVTSITGSLKFKIQCAARPGTPLNMLAF